MFWVPGVAGLGWRRGPRRRAGLRWCVEAVLEQAGIGAHPAFEVTGFEQRSSELLYDERAQQQWPDDQDKLLEGTPEGIAVGTDHPGAGQCLVGAGRGVQQGEQFA